VQTKTREVLFEAFENLHSQEMKKRVLDLGRIMPEKQRELKIGASV
jgi:hypothetical protein